MCRARIIHMANCYPPTDISLPRSLNPGKNRCPLVCRRWKMLGAATKRAFFQKMNITRIYAVRRSEIKRNQAAWYAKKSKKKKRKKRRRRRIRTRPVETSGNRGGEEKKTNVDSTAVSSQVLTFFSIPSFFFLSFVPWTNICILRGRNRTIATAELGRTGLWNLEIFDRVFETLDAAVSTWDSNVETTRGTPVTRDIRPTGGYTAI